VINEILNRVNREKVGRRHAMKCMEKVANPLSDTSEIEVDDSDLETFWSLTENSKDMPSRGSMRLVYKTNDPFFSYADYFRECADKCIRMWHIKEGSYTLRAGPNTPECAGIHHGEEPLFGTLTYVLCMMFAMKMESQSANYYIHDATERSFRTYSECKYGWDSEWLDKLESGANPGRFGAVYYAGVLFVTKDRKRFDSLVMMAESTVQ